MASYRNESLRIYRRIFCLLTFHISTLIISPASAQIVPDSTLGNNSSIVQKRQNTNGNSSSLITGGSRSGSNLLHSFNEFNVGEGQSVFFDNPSAINTIISRVTGNNTTRILGLLGVRGTARLFLLNSNGIFFGSNAAISLNNSFLVSTANRIGFLDDSSLFTRPPLNSTEVLSRSRPSRLIFDSRTGPIRVKGLGNNLSDLAVMPIDNPIIFPFGLSVSPDSTIALIGGNVEFDSGVLRSFGGNIEIGGVRGHADIRLIFLTGSL
ncbi:filamentous hemagglutinin N-terminal domain-containing protein [Acaryochloris thomasi]|nr:filamentous hemagglutinin N-terminal domain-containing protein [Acaryochloris thomasi]